MRAPVVSAIVGAVLLGAGCGGGAESSLPVGRDPVSLDPSDFTTDIDNPYWPMAPGTHWVYRATDAAGNVQRVVVTVTDRTRSVMGIEARVVHDLVVEDGATVEDTYDWYAQDADGNVWYLGEDTKEFEDGKAASTAGSWEAGVDGAMPGIAVPAHPEVGLVYRQEYKAGEAEDAASVLSLDERADAPAGVFERTLMTKDYTPLDPAVLEYKFYAPGIGPVVSLGVAGEIGREELVEHTTP